MFGDLQTVSWDTKYIVTWLLGLFWIDLKHHATAKNETIYLHKKRKKTNQCNKILRCTKALNPNRDYVQFIYSPKVNNLPIKNDRPIFIYYHTTLHCTLFIFPEGCSGVRGRLILRRLVLSRRLLEFSSSTPLVGS